MSEFNWQDFSLCGAQTAHLFFDVDNYGNYVWEQEAKQMCAECPVRIPCLDDAMSNPKLRNVTGCGIYGGLTDPERRRLRSMRGNLNSAVGDAVKSVVGVVQDTEMRRLQRLL